jgi:hypothetical protein
MSDKAYVNVGVHSDLELGSRPNTPGFSPPSNQLKSSKTIYVYDGGDGEITLERLLSILFDVRPFPVCSKEEYIDDLLVHPPRRRISGGKVLSILKSTRVLLTERTGSRLES